MLNNIEHCLEANKKSQDLQYKFDALIDAVQNYVGSYADAQWIQTMDDFNNLPVAELIGFNSREDENYAAAIHLSIETTLDCPSCGADLTATKELGETVFDFNCRRCGEEYDNNHQHSRRRTEEV